MAVAQSQTQLLSHLCPDINVLFFEEGSTPHLTVAGFSLHVRNDSQLDAMAYINSKLTQQQQRFLTDSCWHGCGPKSDPAAVSLVPRHQCAVP